MSCSTCSNTCLYSTRALPADCCQGVNQLCAELQSDSVQTSVQTLSLLLQVRVGRSLFEDLLC